jgi:hypothetical protein
MAKLAVISREEAESGLIAEDDTSKYTMVFGVDEISTCSKDPLKASLLSITLPFG